MLVVYLSNQFLKVVQGSSNGSKTIVTAMYSDVDQQGAFTNGNINNREELKNSIQNVFEANRLPKDQVYLVLNGNQISTRMIQAPVLKEKALFDYIKRELAGVDRINDPVYGYIPLHKEDKLQSIFAMAAARDYVAQFVEIFKEIGINLAGVEGVKGTMLRMIEKLPEVQGKTCALQLVDHMNLTNILLVDGKYKTSIDKRLFSEPGTPSYAVEVARAVGELLQFAKTQNIEQPINNVYYAGLDAIDCPIYEESVNRVNSDLIAQELIGSNITFQCHLDTNVDYSHFILPIAGLFTGGTKENIMEGMRHTPELSARKKLLKRILIPAVSAVVIMAIMIGFVLAQRGIYQKELDTLNAYVKNPEVLEKEMRYEELSARMDELTQVDDSIERFKSVLAEYPIVDSTIIKKMQSLCSDAVVFTITGFDATNGKLRFECVSSDVEEINKFVDALESTGIMTGLAYGGYNYSGNAWTVNLTGLVAPVETEGTTDEAEN